MRGVIVPVSPTVKVCKAVESDSVVLRLPKGARICYRREISGGPNRLTFELIA